MKLYAIVFKESKEILDPKTIKKYWPNYGSAGSSGLYGWRPPKKIYDTLGRARTGFAHIPEQIKDQLAIATFTFDEFVEDGDDIKKVQEANREKKKILKEKRLLKYQKERLERDKAEIARREEELNKKLS
jgi:HD-like signal output (HDOD) protein